MDLEYEKNFLWTFSFQIKNMTLITSASMINYILLVALIFHLFTSNFKSVTFCIIGFVPINKLCNGTTRLNVQCQFIVHSKRCEFVDDSCLGWCITIFRITIKHRSFWSYYVKKLLAFKFLLFLLTDQFYVIRTWVIGNQSIGRFILIIS